MSSDSLILIAGPCQIESRDHALMVAGRLRGVIERLGSPVHFYYKSSFTKANRTSRNSPRGIGREEGLRILEEVRRETGFAVLTDVHSVDDVVAAGAVVDVVQIPAFLCRQTDLLEAAGQHCSVVNIKKGQFLHPEDMKFAAEKVEGSGGSARVFLTERGACFGYRDLVVDLRSLVMMQALSYPVIYDATHSVQRMGGQQGSSGGDRRFVEPLLHGAIGVGVDGVFLECHEDPDRAPSDGATMISLDVLEPLLTRVLAHHRFVREEVKLEKVVSA